MFTFIPLFPVTAYLLSIQESQLLNLSAFTEKNTPASHLQVDSQFLDKYDLTLG